MSTPNKANSERHDANEHCAIEQEVVSPQLCQSQRTNTSCHPKNPQIEHAHDAKNLSRSRSTRTHGRDIVVRPRSTFKRDDVSIPCAYVGGSTVMVYDVRDADLLVLKPCFLVTSKVCIHVVILVLSLGLRNIDGSQSYSMGCTFHFLDL